MEIMKAIRILLSILSLPLMIVFLLPIWCYLVCFYQPDETHTRAEHLGNQMATTYKKFVNWSW